MRQQSNKSLKQRLSRIIFETDTPLAKAFDIALMIIIFLSVLLVVIESIQPIKAQYGYEFYMIEWVITILFTIEYLLRLYLARHALNYALSFYGIIDLLAILPTYIELFVSGPHFLMVIRTLRLLRLFRILKLTRYIRAAENIKDALKASRIKITVFLGAIITVVVVLGAFMYIVEGPENGFNNIPVSVYWAIQTITPVSEGSLTAKTDFGRAMAAILMILGYAILAIPTGIVSSEITKASYNQQNKKICPNCSRIVHEEDAKYCNYCGSELNA